MEIMTSSIQMATAWAENPHWHLTYIQWHCYINLLAPELFFLILAHSVYKT